MTEFRTGYGPHLRVPMVPKGESMTHQAFKDEVNINRIMAKFERTKLAEHVNRYQGRYDDFTMVPDFHTAMNSIVAAEEMFLTLPAKLRKEFGNDVGAFLELAGAVEEGHPDAIAEFRRFGLLPSERPATPAVEPAPQGDGSPAPEPATPPA